MTTRIMRNHNTIFFASSFFYSSNSSYHSYYSYFLMLTVLFSHFVLHILLYQAIVMNPGSTHSVEIYFTPADSNFVQSEIIVEFISGGRVYIAVTGQGENVDVVLSTPSLSMDPSFISLLSHRTLKIRNLSSQTVTYTWKSYSTLSEEDDERDRLLYEINRMESIEKNVLLDKVMGGGFDGALEDEEAGFEPRVVDKVRGFAQILVWMRNIILVLWIN